MDKTYRKSETRIYHVWNGMIGRCTHESYPSFKVYGGRGIEVCPEWRNSFEAFKEWAMANGYADNLTLDRLDGNGNYEPSNCRWATVKEQNSNKVNNHLVTFNGQTKTVSQWAEELGMKTQTLFSRFKRNWSVERALTTQTRGRKM
jgi:hypothetical protein